MCSRQPSKWCSNDPSGTRVISIDTFDPHLMDSRTCRGIYITGYWEMQASNAKIFVWISRNLWTLSDTGQYSVLLSYNYFFYRLEFDETVHWIVTETVHKTLSGSLFVCLKLVLCSRFQSNLFKIIRRSSVWPPLQVSTCIFGVNVVNCPGF